MTRSRKQRVEPGTVVCFDYVLETVAGLEIERGDPERPVGYVHGRAASAAGKPFVARSSVDAVFQDTATARRLERLRPLLPSVHGALRGKPLGNYTIQVRARDAHGERDPSLVSSIPRRRLPGTIRAAVGVPLEVTLDDGVRREARIAAIGRDDVTIDANHALAGMDLRLRVAIRQVRAATRAELRDRTVRTFPFDVFAEKEAFPGEIGDYVRRVVGISCFSPHPWGPWLYGRMLRERCRALEGDIAELGVGAGGTSIFLGLVARDLGKRMYSFDSFAGLPAPDSENDNDYFREGDYAGSSDLLSRFRRSLSQFGLRRSVTPVAGFFEKTLARWPADRRLCFAHLDSDLYGSIKTSLEGIYDKVVEGGVIAIDEFFHPAQGPARACAAFFNRRKLRPLYHVSFPCSVVVMKGEDRGDRVRALDGNAYSFDYLREDDVLRGALRSSLARACPGTAASKSCRLLCELLERGADRELDIYTYWLALQEFWEMADSVGSSREPQRI